MGSYGHRLAIGPGGSGTSHRLTQWLVQRLAQSVEDPGFAEARSAPLEVRGAPSVPLAPDATDRLRAAAAEGRLIVAHDVHWIPDEMLVELVHATDQTDVWASRRPWPVTDLIRSLDDRLTAARPAERLGPLSVDELAPLVAQLTGRAAPSVVVDALHEMTAGLVGPACDAMAEGWSPDSPLSPELRDRLLHRVGRSGALAAAFVRMLVVDSAIESALADRLALASSPSAPAGTALRASTAGGLVDANGRVVPLIAQAVRDDLTDAEIAQIHAQLAAALTDIDRDRSVDHAVAGAVHVGGQVDELLAAVRADLVSDPARASAVLDRARSAGANRSLVALLDAELHLRAGRTEALAALGRIGDDSAGSTSLEAVRLGMAADLRAGRWDRVAAIDDEALRATPDPSPSDGAVTAEIASIRRLARLLVIADEQVAASDSSISTAQRRPSVLLATALGDALAGRHVEALRHAMEGADDEVAGDDEQLVGIGASVLAALLALTLGDLPTADSVLARSIAAQRPIGEMTASRPLHRYVALRRARGSGSPWVPADDADGATSDTSTASAWARDLLLHAAVDTAIARRTGDPVRLRDAWMLADPVLVRVHSSWLFLEPLAELLITGVRLGRSDRVRPVVEALEAQVSRGVPADGSIAASLAWATLHLALAAGDLDGVEAAVARLRTTAGASAHSRARAQAGEVWARLGSGAVDESSVVGAVDALLEVDEGWEAARLAGQAALDADDPMVTRRLLERARAAAPDPVPARSDGDGPDDGLVSAGLSEREAEVARLVTDGRTYKEIGAELYISAKTVEHHVARVRQKLGVQSRAELLAVVREHDGRRR